MREQQAMLKTHSTRPNSRGTEEAARAADSNSLEGFIEDVTVALIVTLIAAVSFDVAVATEVLSRRGHTSPRH